MKRAEVFIFDSYEIVADLNQVIFRYKIVFDELHSEEIKEKWSVPKQYPLTSSVALERTLESIHIAAGISYFKTFFPKTINTTRPLSNIEAEFWNNVYEKGLREFCYINKLEIPLAKFEGSNNHLSPFTLKPDPSAILGIGGGKDSIVAGELMRELDLELMGFVLDTGTNPGQTDDVAKAMSLPAIHISRYLDNRLFELGKKYEGLNGHVPISVLFSLSGLLLALLTNSKYVTVGNEAGASIPNLVWNDKEVNHQWSKSLEYEKEFQNFVKQIVSPNITYFSPLRPLSSVAITKFFCDYPQYFNKFTSCNLVLRIDPAKRPPGRWCQECEKCLSSFILFAPWLPEETVISIFGKDLLNESELTDSLLALLGLSGHKPLNCVGTPEELLSSYVRLCSQGKFGNSSLTHLPQLTVLPANEELETFLFPRTDDAIPSELKVRLFELYKKHI